MDTRRRVGPVCGCPVLTFESRCIMRRRGPPFLSYQSHRLRLTESCPSLHRRLAPLPCVQPPAGLLLHLPSVFADRFHKRFVFRHLFKGTLDVLYHDQIREAWAQLQELLEVSVISGALADAFLLKDTEEVLRVHDVEGLLLGLAFDVLLVDNVCEEVSCAHVLL